MTRLAVYTFAVLAEAPDHPQVRGFFESNSPNLAAAQASVGFIARSGYDGEPGPPSWGAMAYPRHFPGNDEGWTPATLSLWRDLESLAAYVYHGLHGRTLNPGRKWFVEPRWPTHVLWWVGDGHTPDWSEAVARHEHLHDHGPSVQAFKLLRIYDADGKRVQLERARIAHYAGANQARLAGMG